jgi:hypothetical protein
LIRRAKIIIGDAQAGAGSMMIAFRRSFFDGSELTYAAGIKLNNCLWLRIGSEAQTLRAGADA